MSSTKSVWYRLGYALEQAREAPSKGSRKLAGLKERASLPAEKSENSPTALDMDEILTAAGVALAAKLLDRRHGGGILSMVRAALAGAGAGLLVELVRPLLSGRADLGSLDEDTPDRLLAGAVQGLVYGTLLEPWIPGPSTLKGVVYGSAEYAATGMGGIGKMVGGHSSLGRLPGVGPLLADLDPQERAYVEHVVFGVALAVLYGSPSSNGIRDEGA